MSQLNLLVFLQSYEDSKSSNNPLRSGFKWNREIDSIPGVNAIGQIITLQPSETRTIFTGSAIKKLLYMESDQRVTMLINGAGNDEIKPLVLSTSVQPGVFLRTSDITSLVVTNTSATVVANMFIATIE